MTPALRWAVMRAIFRDKVTGQCPQTRTFEEKGEPKRIRTEVPNSKYWFTTSFLWRKVPESDARSVPRSHCLPAQRLTARPNRRTACFDRQGVLCISSNTLCLNMTISWAKGEDHKERVGNKSHSSRHFSLPVMVSLALFP